MNSNAVRGTVKSKILVTYSTLKSIALAIAVLSKPVEHYLDRPHVRLAQNVLMSPKLSIDVDSHNDDRFIGCRCPQPVAYSRNASGLQQHTELIAFIGLRVDFEEDVRKIPDRHVEVILGGVPHFSVI